jgi:hypothetical protein
VGPRRGFAPFTAADKDVVSSSRRQRVLHAFLDLKQGAALVSVPDTCRRYYSLMLADAYANVFGDLGERATGDKAGRYLIIGPGWKGNAPEDARIARAARDRAHTGGQADGPKCRHWSRSG